MQLNLTHFKQWLSIKWFINVWDDLFDNVQDSVLEWLLRGKSGHDEENELSLLNLGQKPVDLEVVIDSGHNLFDKNEHILLERFCGFDGFVILWDFDCDCGEIIQ